MGLRILDDDGVFTPIAICDRCKQRIEVASEGNYLWEAGTETSLLMFEHKKCHEAGRFLTGELSWLPIFLGNSLRIDWEKAREDTEMIGRIG